MFVLMEKSNKMLGKWVAIIAILLTVAKASGHGNYHWVWAAAPILGLIAINIILLMIAFIFAAIMDLKNAVKKMAKARK